MNTLTRRCFVTAVGTLGALSTVARRATLRAAQVAGAAAAQPPYAFFDATDLRFVEAACARLIPAIGSPCREPATAVCRYLDRHLAGAWGAGRRPYREGPWLPGSRGLGARHGAAPAQVFRAGLRAIAAEFASRGIPFDRLAAGAQDDFLRVLQAGGRTLGSVPSADFFHLLLTLTVEGFFSSVPTAVVTDRIGWRMAGYPGAFAARLGGLS